ncbi:unnamed protein product, partial [Polarella glacialis]
MPEQFEVTASVVNFIKSILNDYPGQTNVLYEQLQNADDAGARKVKFLLNERTYAPPSQWQSLGLEHPDLLRHWMGPALYVWNDAVFTDDDFKNLSVIGRGGKANNVHKTGKFGIGFNAVYHLTDLPSIVSGNYVVFCDPQQKYLGGSRPGVKIRIPEARRIPEDFACYEILGQSPLATDVYAHTLIRLPLRQGAAARKPSSPDAPGSEIQAREVLSSEVYESFVNFRHDALVFLRNVEEIEFLVQPADPGRPAEILRSVAVDAQDLPALRAMRRDFTKALSAWRSKPAGFPGMSAACSFRLNCCESQGHAFSERWLVQQQVGGQTHSTRSKRDLAVKETASELATRAVQQSVKQHGQPEFKFRPVGVAAFLLEGNSPEGSGSAVLELGSRWFCSLPLPVSAAPLPFHVNGLLDLPANRRSIKWETQDASLDDSCAWNRALVATVIAPAAAAALEKARDMGLPLPDFYRLWPSDSGATCPATRLLASAVFQLAWQRPLLHAGCSRGWVTGTQAVLVPWCEQGDEVASGAMPDAKRRKLVQDTEDPKSLKPGWGGSILQALRGAAHKNSPIPKRKPPRPPVTPLIEDALNCLLGLVAVRVPECFVDSTQAMGEQDQVRVATPGLLRSALARHSAAAVIKICRAPQCPHEPLLALAELFRFAAADVVVEGGWKRLQGLPLLVTEALLQEDGSFKDVVALGARTFVVPKNRQEVEALSFCAGEVLALRLVQEVGGGLFDSMAASGHLSLEALTLESFGKRAAAWQERLPPDTWEKWNGSACSLLPWTLLVQIWRFVQSQGACTDQMHANIAKLRLVPVASRGKTQLLRPCDAQQVIDPHRVCCPELVPLLVKAGVAVFAPGAAVDPIVEMAIRPFLQEGSCYNIASALQRAAETTGDLGLTLDEAATILAWFGSRQSECTQEVALLLKTLPLWARLQAVQVTAQFSEGHNIIAPTLGPCVLGPLCQAAAVLELAGGVPPEFVACLADVYFLADVAGRLATSLFPELKLDLAGLLERHLCPWLCELFQQLQMRIQPKGGQQICHKIRVASLAALRLLAPGPFLLDPRLITKLQQSPLVVPLTSNGEKGSGYCCAAPRKPAECLDPEDEVLMALFKKMPWLVPDVEYTPFRKLLLECGMQSLQGQATRATGSERDAFLGKCVEALASLCAADRPADKHIVCLMSALVDFAVSSPRKCLALEKAATLAFLPSQAGLRLLRPAEACLACDSWIMANDKKQVSEKMEPILRKLSKTQLATLQLEHPPSLERGLNALRSAVRSNQSHSLVLPMLRFLEDMLASGERSASEQIQLVVGTLPCVPVTPYGEVSMFKEPSHVVLEDALPPLFWQAHSGLQNMPLLCKLLNIPQSLSAATLLDGLQKLAKSGKALSGDSLRAARKACMKIATCIHKFGRGAKGLGAQGILVVDRSCFLRLAAETVVLDSAILKEQLEPERAPFHIAEAHEILSMDHLLVLGCRRASHVISEVLPSSFRPEPVHINDSRQLTELVQSVHFRQALRRLHTHAGTMGWPRAQGPEVDFLASVQIMFVKDLPTELKYNGKLIARRCSVNQSSSMSDFLQDAQRAQPPRILLCNRGRSMRPSCFNVKVANRIMQAFAALHERSGAAARPQSLTFPMPVLVNILGCRSPSEIAELMDFHDILQSEGNLDLSCEVGDALKTQAEQEHQNVSCAEGPARKKQRLGSWVEAVAGAAALPFAAALALPLAIANAFRGADAAPYQSCPPTPATAAVPTAPPACPGVLRTSNKMNTPQQQGLKQQVLQESDKAASHSANGAAAPFVPPVPPKPAPPARLRGVASGSVGSSRTQAKQLCNAVRQHPCGNRAGNTAQGKTSGQQPVLSWQYPCCDQADVSLERFEEHCVDVEGWSAIPLWVEAGSAEWTNAAKERMSMAMKNIALTTFAKLLVEVATLLGVKADSKCISIF